MPTSAVAVPSGWDRAGSRAVWWLFPVLLPLLGLRMQYGPFSFGLTGLWLPVAAWLGARHGRHGFLLVAVAGVPLLFLVGVGGISTSGNIGLYVASLLLCRLFGQSTLREDCVGSGGVTLWALAFLFVVLATGVSFLHRFGSFDVGLDFGLRVYIWMVFAVLGLSAAPLRLIVILLCVAAVIGCVQEQLIGTSTFGGFRVIYLYAGTASVITGIVALWLGRSIRHRIVADVAPGRIRIEQALAKPAVGGALLFLALLASGFELYGPTVPSGLQLGSATSNAMLLFACGMLYGARGIGIALLAWFGVTATLALLALTGVLDPPASPRFTSVLNPGSPRLFLGPPPSMIPSFYWFAPSVRLAPLDPLFAVFGWRVAVALLRVGRTAPAIAVDREPPSLRYRARDRWLVGLAGACLVLSTAFWVILRLSKA